MSNAFQSADAWEVSTERILGDGNHVVNITEAEMGKSSGGHPQLKLQLKNPQGEIRDWLVITEASVGKVVSLAQSAGVRIPEDNDIEQGLMLKQEYADLFVGKTVGIVVRPEKDNRDPTKERMRVQGYTEPSRIKGGSDVTHPSAGRQFANAGANSAGDKDIPFANDGFPSYEDIREHHSRW